MGTLGPEMIVDQHQLSALPSLWAEILFLTFAQDSRGEGDGNVLGRLVVDHSWGPKETHCN